MFWVRRAVQWGEIAAFPIVITHEAVFQSFSRKVLCGGLRISFCCWWVGRWVLRTARAALVTEVHVVRPTHDLCPHHCSCWASTALTAEKGWLAAAEPVILYAWLFKFSSIWMPFVSIHMRHIFFSHSMLFLKISSTYLFPHPLTPIYQTFFFWVPNVSGKLPVAVRESTYLYFWPFLNPDRVDDQLHCFKFCPLGGFPITTVLRASPEWMCCTASASVKTSVN